MSAFEPNSRTAVDWADRWTDKTIGAHNRSLAYKAITNERLYQNRKYGRPDERRLSVGDYLTIAQAELNEAQCSAADGDTENALRELLQVIAVGVACLERHGIVER